MDKFRLLENSLFVSAANVAVAAVALVCFVVPRFTECGVLLLPLVFVLFLVDGLLVVRDLFLGPNRWRALGAVALWLPVLFVFAMIPQWEGPLYVHVKGTPPTFDMRGMAGACGLSIYGPEHDKAEWYEDDLGLVWSIENSPHHFPTTAELAYGDVPSGFTQTFPANNGKPSALDPTLSYKLVIGRCMGGPQYMSLRGMQLGQYKANPGVCWGELKVPERKNTAWVRVDCNSHQPLPMSERALRRLEAYRKNQISLY